jgi:hypothetical protein
MGFVNISGQTVHTSSISAPVFGTPSISNSVGNSGIINISGTNSSITTSTLSSGQYLTWGGSTMNYINKTTYHVLGEDIEVDGYGDPHIAVAISTLNVLGKPFYDELKKNNLTLPSEIEEYLEKKFKILERDRKIKEILKS